jgi:hypothetical protein
MTVQGPEPSGYELQRSIDRVEQGMSHGLSEIKILIAGLVSRDLFDFEAKTQNARILRLEQDLERFQEAEKSSKQRFWLNVVIPLLTIAAGVAIAVLL